MAVQASDSPRPCASDSRKYRRIFEPHEDERLLRVVEQFGTDDWVSVAANMPNRTARLCRVRSRTYLCPDVNVSPWTQAEDRLLMSKYEELGSRWIEFRPFFKKRTVNGIKNRWHTLARRGQSGGDDQCAAPSDAKRRRPVAPFDIENLLNRPVAC
jgi:myb proto-oncogene protein